ncbi:Y-family DNA polymerase [Ciceribacter thiooxidans]|uniref:Y-family DNA polymerase n=2 Tax=Ciceribacter thiooxidans TaxID=1969821 RepID=A0ABV7HTS0_9HYPH|nr:DNA polymerase Y family protein [Ciceribacter thiooxidans]
MARRYWGASWRSTGRPDHPPLVCTGRMKNAMRLTAVDETGVATGLKRGQGLAEARAVCPALDAVIADEAADRRFLEGIADWCDRYTPLVAIEGREGLFLDITGCSHLLGGEELLLRDILKRLFEMGLDARGAISSTPGLSWAMARFGGNGTVSEGHAKSVPASFPVAACRLPEETVLALRKMGLKRVGDLLAAPRAPLVRRFGPLPLLRLDQMLGREDEPISPRRPVADLSVERCLAEPLQCEEVILQLVQRMAVTLKSELEARCQGGRRFELLLFRVDGRVFRIGVGSSVPLRDPTGIAALFSERLVALHDDLDTGYGFEILRLNVLQAETLHRMQSDFTGSAPVETALATFVDQAVARLGPDCLMRPVLQESHVPERASLLLPAADLMEIVSPGVEQRETGTGRSTKARRPIRLLKVPEIIEATAEAPEGPPMSFRWRRCLHRVRRAEGPEKLAMEWWIDGEEAPARNYFQVEDDEGHRYWLFREGAYVSNAEMPRWFMHGVFA